jgi:hypothetical protein
VCSAEIASSVSAPGRRELRRGAPADHGNAVDGNRRQQRQAVGVDDAQRAANLDAVPDDRLDDVDLAQQANDQGSAVACGDEQVLGVVPE